MKINLPTTLLSLALLFVSTFASPIRPTVIDSSLDTVARAEGVTKSKAPSTAATNNNLTLKFDKTEAITLKGRQISPLPHFRECKINDPRPECPHPYGRRSIETVEARYSDSTDSVSTYDKPEALEQKERRQISPWPHFRECKKNDPRSECPHPYRRSVDRDLEGSIYERHVSPFP